MVELEHANVRLAAVDARVQTEVLDQTLVVPLLAAAPRSSRLDDVARDVLEVMRPLVLASARKTDRATPVSPIRSARKLL